MLLPLTLLLVLRISAASPSGLLGSSFGLGMFDYSSLLSSISNKPDVGFGLFSSFQNFRPPPPPTTTTTPSSFLAGLGLKYFLNQKDSFDDYDDYKQEEIEEENYKDYETILTVPPDVETHEPLQPDDYDYYYYKDDAPLQPDDEDYGGSTENYTVNSMNQTYYNESDAESSTLSDLDYGTSSWDQFYHDLVNNNTSWDQYNQSDLENNQTYWDQYIENDYDETDWNNNQTDSEYNRTSWDDLILRNLSDWQEDNNETESKPVHQFGSAKYAPHSQPVSQGQGYHLQSGQRGYVQSGQGQFVASGRGQIVINGQGQHVQTVQGQIGTSDQGQMVTSSQGQIGTSGQGQMVSSGQGQFVQSGQGQFVSRGRGQIVINGQGQHVQTVQGQIGTSDQGQMVTSGQGQIGTSGQGQMVTSGQGQIVKIGQGQKEQSLVGLKRRKPNRYRNSSYPIQTKSKELVPVNNRPVYSEQPKPITQNSGIEKEKKQKVRKCCPMGNGYDIEKEICVEVSESFNPPVFDGFYLTERYNATQLFRFHIASPSCSQKGHQARVKMMQVTNISQVYYLRWDGNLVVEFPRDRSPSLSYDPQNYCMDNFVKKYNYTYFDAFICHVESKNHTHTTLSSVCMLVTCFLILLRVILFAWLPELRTLHGMILMAYLISFLVGFMLLSITQLLFELDVIVQDVCTFCSFIIYFSMLSAFFWRNIMCYDIWWTFRGKRAFSSRGFSSRTRFNLYSAYAFGVPMALSVLLGALEFSTLPSMHPLMPKLRLQGCFLYGNSKLLYLYGPIILLFIINVIFSTLTAVKIAAIKKETKTVLQSNESSTHDQQRATQRFSLYLKLFTAMAFLEVNWMLEVVALFAPDITSLLHLSDFYNVIAPLIIFINFICQKQTWKIMRKRYRQMKGLPHSGVPTSGTQTTQSQDDTESQIKQV